MDPSFQNPALVIVILGGISIVTTTYLFIGSGNLVPGIVIKGVCMIGSASYLKKRDRSDCQTA